MDATHESESKGFEDTPLTPTRIGLIACVGDIVIFTVLGFVAFEDPALGALAGILVGVGVYQFLPIFLQTENFEDMEAKSGSPVRRFHRVAAGLGLSAAGIIVFGWGIAEADLAIGIPAALVLAAVIYLVAGFVIPNATVQQ